MKTKKSAMIALLMILPGLGLDCPVDECDPSLSQPNPLALEIEFTVLEGLSSETDTTARVRITGVIRNDGTADYVSGENQQTIQLYENTTYVADQTFQNLAVGEEVTITWETDWDTSNEFPPVYELLIVYDPDILIDDNTGNDDCSLADNATTRDGAEINNLLAAD